MDDEQEQGPASPDGAAHDAPESGDGRWQAPADGERPTPENVRDALRVVIDPELGISVVDLGLIYDVAVDEEVVRVDYTLTSMGCPVGPLIEQQMHQILTQMPGVSIVDARLTFDPPWSPEKMSDDAKVAMGMF